MKTYVNLKCAEFIVTYRCNSHCKHCHVGLEKRKSHPAALSPELARKAVRELAEVYPMQYVMTFGGEPLLYPETVFAVHATATECGIPGRTIITNTSFPTGEDEFRIVAHKLADCGVNSMCLSVDVFHQEYIPLSVVKQNTRLLIEAGIENMTWNVSWVVSPEADNPWDDQTRHILEELADLGLEKDDIKITPDGAAVRNLEEYMPPRRSIPSGTCGDKPFTGRLDEVTSISIEPDGSLTICDELMSIGNLHQGNAAEFCHKYDPYRNPVLKVILEQGPAGLVSLTHQYGIVPATQGYRSVCEMCHSLRKALSFNQQVY
jgi:pyruvate-formate lyase-activating enzyme